MKNIKKVEITLTNGHTIKVAMAKRDWHLEKRWDNSRLEKKRGPKATADFKPHRQDGWHGLEIRLQKFLQKHGYDVICLSKKEGYYSIMNLKYGEIALRNTKKLSNEDWRLFGMDFAETQGFKPWATDQIDEGSESIHLMEPSRRNYKYFF